MHRCGVPGSPGPALGLPHREHLPGAGAAGISLLSQPLGGGRRALHPSWPRGEGPWAFEATAARGDAEDTGVRGGGRRGQLEALGLGDSVPPLHAHSPSPSLPVPWSRDRRCQIGSPGSGACVRMHVHVCAHVCAHVRACVCVRVRERWSDSEGARVAPAWAEVGAHQEFISAARGAIWGPRSSEPRDDFGASLRC